MRNKIQEAELVNHTKKGGNSFMAQSAQFDY